MKEPIVILANLLRLSWITLNLKDIIDDGKNIPKLKQLKLY